MPLNDRDDSFLGLAEQYRRHLLLCRQLEAQKNFLRRRMEQLRGTHDPGVRSVMPVLNAQLRQMSERQRSEEERAAAAAQSLSGAILKLHDMRLEQILRCRYLELMTWDEISEITGVGLRWLHRLHKKGLGRIDG